MNAHSNFYGWDAGRWTEVEDARIRAELYRAFENSVTWLEDEKPKPFRPNKHKITDLVDALRAVAFRPEAIADPCWLEGDGDAPADELIACRNGLLHAPTRRLGDHTPAFFNRHQVPFDYDPSAPQPARWLAFLDELWPHDPEAVACLQEWLGYLVSGDTSLQKMLLLVGPKRSGKGTIARVATQLIGPHHVVGSTLSSLGTNFGLAPLVNATVTFISDARLPNGDTSVITERLLSISGEDTLTVDRKYRSHWTGKLRTRIVVLTNELPKLSDTSGALASRFIVLTMTRSFYGCENPDLTNELCTELPGIFNWALDGLDRLRERRRFEQPSSATEAIYELEDLGSPIGAFIRDRCQLGPEHEVAVETLWDEWRAWCGDSHRDPGTKQTLGRDLHAAFPGVNVVQPRDETGGRYRRYQGDRPSVMGLMPQAATRRPRSWLTKVGRHSGTRRHVCYPTIVDTSAAGRRAFATYKDDLPLMSSENLSDVTDSMRARLAQDVLGQRVTPERGPWAICVA